MTLHTVGPADMIEDEKHIGRAYQAWLTPFLVGAPLGAASYLDTKWVIAIGLSALLAMVHEAGGCGSAWNRDPVGGVIGVQTGPL